MVVGGIHMDAASGCGCKEVYNREISSYYLSLLFLYLLFLTVASLLFVNLLKSYFVIVYVILCKFQIINYCRSFC